MPRNSGPSVPCRFRYRQIAWVIARMCHSLKASLNDEPRCPEVPKATRWAGHRWIGHLGVVGGDEPRHIDQHSEGRRLSCQGTYFHDVLFGGVFSSAGHFGQTAAMTLRTAESCGEKSLDQFPGQRVTDNLPSEANHVQIVVLDALVRRESIRESNSRALPPLCSRRPKPQPRCHKSPRRAPPLRRPPRGPKAQQNPDNHHPGSAVRSPKADHLVPASRNFLARYSFNS